MNTFIEIRTGQVWSVPDKYRGGVRRLRVLSVDPDVNDPDMFGPKVEMVNTETGRRSFPQAHTVRAMFSLEYDVEGAS